MLKKYLINRSPKEGRCWRKSRSIKQGGIMWYQWTGELRGKSAFNQKIDLQSQNLGIGLVVKLKGIKYKKDFLCYLSSITSS